MGRRIGGVVLILVALALFAGPALTLVEVWRSHAAGLGPRAVNGVSYLVTAGAFCLIAGLYFLKGEKNKRSEPHG
jgi:hypothetical protein